MTAERENDYIGKPPGRVWECRGFTLLETVLALAVFAVLVVPAVGLVAFSYRNANTDQQAPNAVEVKSLLEIELRGAETDDGGGPYDVFHTSFLTSDVVLYASQDLQTIEIASAGIDDADKYYKITVAEPSNYTYSANDPYRLFLFNIIWPAFVPASGGGFVDNEDNAEGLQQIILPCVLPK